VQIARFTAAAALLLLLAAAAPAGDVLRVGTSGDYPPFSLEIPPEDESDPAPRFEGFDLAVAYAFAEARGLLVMPTRFRWPHLVRDFGADRFDVAMSGVTVTPERSALGRFSVPVVETGTVVLVRDALAHPDVAALNERNVRIGVNAGGYLERVAAANFREATRVAIPDNLAVLNAFVEGSLDAVVTDTIEAPGWRKMAPDATQLGPLTRDRKAYWIRPDEAALADSLDRWLLAFEASGELAALRAKHFGPIDVPRTAEPLPALLAAMDERLAMMPGIAVAKRRAGIPLVVVSRETRVLDAAVESVRRAAARRGVEPPPEARVRVLFRAQIEAAKQVQRDALADATYERPETIPDIDDVLRPALIRMGEQIARLVVALPPGLSPQRVREAASDQLRTRWLSPASRAGIADAVAALVPETAVQ